MMPALDRFLDALLASPPEIWKPGEEESAADISGSIRRTHRCDFRCFGGANLPALAEGVLVQEPGCARWLAPFESLLVNSPDPLCHPNSGPPAHLLAEAVRLDPTDDIARRRLIERDAPDLEYTLHELPVGVLCGS